MLGLGDVGGARLRHPGLGHDAAPLGRPEGGGEMERCDACGGAVMTETDEWGERERKCLNCGRRPGEKGRMSEQPIEMTAGLPLSEMRATTLAPAPGMPPGVNISGEPNGAQDEAPQPDGTVIVRVAPEPKPAPDPIRQAVIAAASADCKFVACCRALAEAEARVATLRRERALAGVARAEAIARKEELLATLAPDLEEPSEPRPAAERTKGKKTMTEAALAARRTALTAAREAKAARRAAEAEQA